MSGGIEPAKQKVDDYESHKAGDEVRTEGDLSIEQGATESKPRRRQQRNKSASPEISVNMDELRELIHLIRENDFAEFELEREGFRVRFRRGVEAGASEGAAGFQPTPSAGSKQTAANLSPATDTKVTTTSVPAHPGAKAQTAASEDQDLHIIPSPIVGTFYRAASPNAESFVKIGSQVEPETIVCIIEAMKLMNEIQAEASGEVAKIYVENGQPVEYGQPLFGIKK
ncbi:MAG: acetyl-CoA carboxylase biotin carboxyl carrier protein [Acidobacteriota bacterium]|nr:acetyl-CoA carboxylase biotin carboxyl carrier protein [Acidobacteriota bacterium]